MVCLNDIAVNGNLAKIRRHVPGGDELHFLLNQCPFFLCYIEFDLYFSFASVHAITPFRSEGLGHFPTSNFQPTHRRTGGRKYGKGYSFPMLATKVFSSLVTTTQCSICQKRAKEKRCNLKKDYNASENPYSILPDVSICPLFRLLKFPLRLLLQSVCRYRSYHQGERRAAAALYLFRRAYLKETGLRIYCNGA